MIHQSLQSYLWISTALLAIGVFGLLLRRNLVALLISLELVLNSASINFLAFNKFCITNKSVGPTGGGVAPGQTAPTVSAAKPAPEPTEPPKV